MRLRQLALAGLGLALLTPLPAAACELTIVTLAETERVSLEQQLLIEEIELLRADFGDFAADLLRERAELVRRLEDLDLVAEDAFDALSAIRDGLLETDEAGALLLRSPSAVLLREEQRPRLLGRGQRGGATWTRGSWMDSPDGA